MVGRLCGVVCEERRLCGAVCVVGRLCGVVCVTGRLCGAHHFLFAQRGYVVGVTKQVTIDISGTNHASNC